MGYSARYHAFSIIAVFAALAVGIVIGAGLGSDLVSGTTKSLEQSLQEDVREVRAREEQLRSELEREQGFGYEVYPALVGGRLRGEKVGLVALGDLPAALASDVEAALEPTDARIAKIAVIRTPPDLGEVAEGLAGTPLGRVAQKPALARELGRRLGRQLARGGSLLGSAREALLERFSGERGAVDGLVLARTPSQASGGEEQAAAGSFEEGVVDGIRLAGAEAVSVERSDSPTSSVAFFASHAIPTVDSVDLTSGKVAMVFALLGADGSFGVKESADRLLPDVILEPGRQSRPR